MRRAGVPGLSLGAVWLPRATGAVVDALDDKAIARQVAVFSAKRGTIGRPTRSPGACIEAAAWRDLIGADDGFLAYLLRVRAPAAIKEPLALGAATAHACGLWPYSRHLDAGHRVLASGWCAEAAEELRAIAEHAARRAELEADLELEANQTGNVGCEQWVQNRRCLALRSLIDAWPQVVAFALAAPTAERSAPVPSVGAGEYLILDIGVVETPDSDVTLKSAKTIFLDADRAERWCAAGAVVPLENLAAWRERLGISASDVPDGAWQSVRQAALNDRGL